MPKIETEHVGLPGDYDTFLSLEISVRRDKAGKEYRHLRSVYLDLYGYGIAGDGSTFTAEDLRMRATAIALALGVPLTVTDTVDEP